MLQIKHKIAVLLMALLGLAQIASSQTANPKSTVIQDFNADLADSPTPKIRIDSIFPDRGPMTGETHVIVRGGPFGKWQTQHQKPVVSVSKIKASSANLEAKLCALLM